MASKIYSMLPQHQIHAVDDIDDIRSNKPAFADGTWIGHKCLLWTTLLTSMLANILFINNEIRVLSKVDDVSKYARLARDVPTVRKLNTTYSHHDRAVRDAAWADPILNADRAYIALDEEYTKTVGLLHSTRWPWDTTKGIYVIAGMHEMHCLHMLRGAIDEAHDGVPLSYPYAHAVHCLDVLRDTVMCNADDEPLYTGALHSQRGIAHPKSGIGSVKMCRDWTKLSNWALERSACWSSQKQHGPEASMEDRFKHCPDGSTPWET